MTSLAPPLALGLAGLLLTTPALAAGLNDTGQLTCLDGNNQWTTACVGSPMDAGSGRDRSKPRNADGLAGFSYTRVCNNGDTAGTGSCPAKPGYGMGATKWGCTRDEVTGLLWELKDGTNGQSRRYIYSYYPTLAGYSSSPVDGMRISDYVAWANKQALCGRTDWRLPSLPEVTGLMRFGGSDPVNAVPHAEVVKGFPDLQVANAAQRMITVALDASVGDDGNPPYANFTPAGWVPNDIGDHANQLGVRLVAGSLLSPSLRVQGTDGDEVLDRSTGLVWRRCRLGMVWNGSACLGTPSSVSWETAMVTAAAQGWRLPNVKEVVSLMINTGPGVRLDSRFFPGLLSDGNYVWTATHAGESTSWDGGREVLAQMVGITDGTNYWTHTIGRIWKADGTETDYARGSAQVLLVRDR